MSTRGMQSTSRSLEDVIIRLRSRSSQPHFRAIAEKILPVARLIETGECPRSDVHKLAQDIEIIVDSVPEIGPGHKRVLFDMALIQATVVAWGTAGIPVSGMIFPNYGGEWNHKYLHLPSANPEAIPRIDLIGFPGKDDLEDISLVDYAWVYHELGHVLLHAHGSRFHCHVDAQIDAFVKRQKLRALADSDLNRKRAESALDRLQGFWSPGESAWSSEVACDIIGLWTSGPVFLQAFVDVLDDRDPDPYHIGMSHPPYEVRALALIRAAEQLGWSDEVGELRNKIDSWKESPFAEARTNEYLSLTHGHVVDSAVCSAIWFCTELGMGACDKEKVEAVEGLLAADKTPDFGPELVIAACLVRQRDSVDCYQSWERKVIQALASTVTL